MARPICVAEDIVPLNEFKARASRMLRQLRDTHRPLVITQNGKPSAVVLTPEEFDALSYRGRFIASVEAGIRDADAGRVVSAAEVRRRIESEFPGDG